MEVALRANNSTFPAVPEPEADRAAAPRLFSIKEAAVYLVRSVPSIRELIWASSLPIVRVFQYPKMESIEDPGFHCPF